MRGSINRVVLTSAAALFAVLSAELVLSPAHAATSTSVDGHFKESYPQGQPPPTCFTGAPCGIGELKGFGKAAETFTFGGSDGRDPNGCNHIHGTTVIVLDDAARSQFTELEHDTVCTPGASHQAPGHFNSYGNPESFTGTWNFVGGSGTGVFASTCDGAGDVQGHFDGGTGIIDYMGSLVQC